MQKIARKIVLGLSALLLIATALRPSVAQDRKSGDAVAVVQAGAPRGTPQIAQLRARARLASDRAALIRADRVARDKTPDASEPTWRETPSLMDSSWRLWPSLTDF
jgi:hypothetical protein